MREKTLSELAAEKRREYKRQWYAQNRERAKEHTRRYWERKARQEQDGENQESEVEAHA
ncbi:MAG: phosphatase [Oscillospiraceae bacterium]|nr:phosphatase [Oscillospiraceae bacterium]